MNEKDERLQRRGGDLSSLRAEAAQELEAAGLAVMMA